MDKHIGVIINGLGKIPDILSIEANLPIYKQLLKWAQSFGDLQRTGIEGTGTYGAGLARFLSEHGVLVLEINRPGRSARRFRGKSDPTDAESAVRTVLSAGKDCAVPKSQSGAAEATPIVSVARRSTVKARHHHNRGGNRAANNALRTIAMVRMRSDPRPQAYVARRTAEGKSVQEIHRCLIRYIIRELYPIILADLRDSAFC